MTHHLPISIPDILHGKTVERERLELVGWNRHIEQVSRKYRLDACIPCFLW